MSVPTTSSEPALAPAPPGRLGVPVAAPEALRYLDELGTWLDLRKGDLDTLDAAALAAADRDAVTGDLVTSMALWKAISDRYALLKVTFDSGRVGPTESQRLSTLIWGRLDVTPEATGTSGAAGAASGPVGASARGGFAVTLPEACRLSDAMVASLRARLALDGGRAQAGARLAVVRAGIERLRDQVALVPAGPQRDAARASMTRLDQRALDLEGRVVRGADVGGLLGPLEIEVATAERDLIVAAAARVAARRDRDEVLARRTQLEATAAAVASLESRCVAELTAAPTLAIPQVRALGEVPTEPAALAAYEAKLDAVSRALAQAHAAYAGALAAREEALGLAGALLAEAATTRLTGAAAGDLAALTRLVGEATAATPTDVRRAGALVAALQAYLTTTRSTTPPTTRKA